MKKYEEMAKNVLDRIDEYEAERKMKRAKMTKVAVSVTPVCAAAVVGVGLWKGGVLSSDNNKMSGSSTNLIAAEQDTTEVNTATAVITTDDAANNTEPVTAEIRTTEAVSTQLEEIITQEQQAEVTEAVTSQQATTEAATTEAPAVQTEVPVQQTEPATQSVPAEQTAPDKSGMLWCIFGSSIEWNGITYNDNTTIDAPAYTQDKYIGKVSEFKGEYNDSGSYLIDPDDSVYTTKENPYVLIVVKAEPYPFYGSIIAMTNPAYLDGVVYKPHTEDVPYEDIPVYNGSVQVIF